MKTICFKISYDEESKKIIDSDLRVFSSAYRMAYNLFWKGESQTAVYKTLGKHFVNKIPNYILTSASTKASANYKADIALNKEVDTPNFKTIFGGRKNFRIYNNACVNKDEELKAKYKKIIADKRNIGLWSNGQANCQGNRHFKIDLTNKIVIYKRTVRQHLKLQIINKLSSKQELLLSKIYLAMVNGLSPVTFGIKNDNLYIAYDESVIEKEKQFSNLKDNRILGIDLNPEYIGFSILEFNDKDEFKVLHKELIELTDLQDQDNRNKVKFELYQIDNHILKLCKHYKVSKLVVEDLKFKNQKQRYFRSESQRKHNKLLKNKWCYSLTKQNLQVLCGTYGVKFVEINPAYSSVIGNFLYGSKTTPDLVAASIELARRGYKKFLKSWFYPKMVSIPRAKEVLGTQWKDELTPSFRTWKRLGEKLRLLKQSKKTEIMYRYPLVSENAVREILYKKRLYTTYLFS